MSHEEDLAESHDIEPNGYNIGRSARLYDICEYFTHANLANRNELVATATAGQTSFGGVTYSTTAENITGLLAPGSAGVNHGTCDFIYSRYLF